MGNLTFVLERLEEHSRTFNGEYFIPEVWNSIDYCNFCKEPTKEGQIKINPYDFMISCIKFILLNGDNDQDCHMPLSYKNLCFETSYSKSVIYSILPRTFTAWDHYNDGAICSGTFLKTICLLPYLKKLQVDIIYLLPIFKYSDKYKKGELGSPYAIKNFYQLDASLHDELLGENNEIMLETEFKALIEASHLLGMKVILDFVFRTVSRDNDLIVEHPDWFYWIHRQNSQTFLPPNVENEKKLAIINDKRIKSLYTCKEITEYLAQFTYPPTNLDPSKWQQVLIQYYETQTNILDLIEKTYHITTAPGFSNVINDPQPAWTDVTYLKFYHDGNPKTKQYISEGQPPYVLQDVACLNRYRGTLPNRDLWDYILGIIPYYQDKFKIDGARIDMGHALPADLNKEIMARVKDKNKEFIFWSEEFSPEKSQLAKKDGFNFISGNLWSVYNEVDKPSFYKKLTRTVECAELPLTAALETPDTPRLAQLYREKQKITLLVLLNFLMANTIPFINNGMELLEIQPMNLGLNNDETGRFVLEKRDPMYGKLAFFDNYRLHWLNLEQEWMRRLLIEVLTLRKRFSDLIGERVNLISRNPLVKNPKILFYCYYDRRTQHNLFFLANKHFRERARVHLNILFPEEVRTKYQNITWVYTGNKVTDLKRELNQSRFMDPGEVLVGYLE
jgi:starch synthase (maltosyl-transferring)